MTITGEHKGRVDKLCTTFWNNGISNPLTIIEQISYLIFLRRLDELEAPVFGPEQQVYRWSHLAAETDPSRQYSLVSEGAFPFLKRLSSAAGSAYATHMKDAVFMLRSPELLRSVIDQIDALPLRDQDINGDLYEYMLSKLSLAGRNGQFRTPRHIIALMVRMLELQPDDTICDPACGTAGFLTAAADYLREAFPQRMRQGPERAHFDRGMFNGFDFDSTMLRLASMNLWLHGVGHPQIERRDFLSACVDGLEDRFSVVLANPPFKGQLDHHMVAADLLQLIRTRKAELLFLAQMIRTLQPGGRAAVIVPEGVLFGGSKAHRAVRQLLVDDHRLDGVISLPAGVFRPYAGVSTAILLFTKTNLGGTARVFFYEVLADGYSLDDRREAIGEDDLPDCLQRWRQRDPERDLDRTSKGFFVGRDEIVGRKYDLSHRRYKEVVYEEPEHEAPADILAKLRALDAEISADMDVLEGML